MARNRMARGNRRPSNNSSNSGVNRYTERTLKRDREYGFYWYSWLWKVLRPLLVLACSLVVVLGIVATGYTFVNERFFMAVEPGNADTVDFVVESGNSVTTISDNLETQELVRSGSIFKYIIQFQGLTSKLQAGSYPLSRDMNVMQVVDKLTEGSASNERTITIIPGRTIEQIADDLKRQGALTDTQAFLELAGDFERFKGSSYPLAEAEELAANRAERKYQLEGYLAPDTYRVYANASAEDIILRLLGQTDVVFNSVFNTLPAEDILLDEEGNRLNEEGELYGEEDEPVYFETTLTTDQTIVLASIIEKEAGKRDDFAKVSAVFHNRIERGMRLESDATVAYLTGIDRLVLTSDELATVNGYNTYTRDGLPIGPICNPSKAAMQAALYPDTDYIYDGYIYFCTGDPEKNELVFAKTRDEHLTNVATYRPLWIAQDEKAARSAG